MTNEKTLTGKCRGTCSIFELVLSLYPAVEIESSGVLGFFAASFFFLPKTNVGFILNLERRNVNCIQLVHLHLKCTHLKINNLHTQFLSAILYLLIIQVVWMR